jgi:DNA-binding transcriptional MocR family regulator
MIQFLDIEGLVASLGAWTGRRGPRYMRLADAIEDAIHQDGIEAGAILPAERALAEAIALSRGTVVAAYGVLVERGLVERRRGSGTRVAGSHGPTGARAHRNPQFNRMVSGPPAAIDLSIGAPYVDDIVAGLRADLDMVLRAGAPGHGYAPLGLPELRDGVAAMLTDEATPTVREQVMMTMGAQGGLQLVTTAFIRPGDRVVVEAPTYPGAIEIFSRAGAVVIGVRRDHAGPRPDDLERALGGPGAALVFLVPTCHNPTGSVMHEARRRELLAICARHDVLVLEDQTTGNLVFDGDVPPTLAALAPDRVLALGSFSKVLWGGLRTGWLRADEATVLRLGRLQMAQSMGVGLYDQAAVLSALPRLGEIAAARRAMAAARYAVLAGAIADRLPEWELVEPRGGYSLWVRLPGHSGEAFTSAALQRGVAIGAGTASAPDELFLDHVRICFSAAPELLVEAVDRLAAVWAERPRGPMAALAL